MEFYSQSFNDSSSSNVIQADGISLFVPYLSMVTTVITCVIVIPPPLMIINVIWWTRELHTKYFFFLAHLLATNVVFAVISFGVVSLIIILYLLGVNSESTVIVVKWLGMAPYVLFYLINIFSPVPLAVERMIVIAFPYHHKSIMTNKTAAGMLAAMWGVSVILTIIIITTLPFIVVWPIAMVYFEQNFYPFLVGTRIPSVVCIVVANVILQYKITISNRKAKENQRLGNEEEVTRFKNLLQEVQAQAKTTITLFLVGGIEIIANILIPVIYGIIDTSVEPSKKIYVLRFSLHFIDTCILLSQSLVYGLCIKKIRKRLPNCTLCHRQWITCHNRVGILHHTPQVAVKNDTK